MIRSVLVATLLATASLPLPALAAGEAGATQRQAVRFADGASSAQVRGSTGGDADAEYTVDARAGQTRSASLTSKT